MRMNCCGRFGFGGSTVLVVRSGHPVSCYTTVGGGGDRKLLIKGLQYQSDALIIRR